MGAAKLRFGVIGAGGFADICHIPGIAGHPGATVAALCGRRREKAEAQARLWGIPHVFADYRELLASDKVDAVSIVTPNVSHAEIAEAAFAAGKHVFCEKPLAMSAAEARRMEAAAAKAGKVNMVAFTFRYLHGVRRLRALVADGAIGTPYYVRLWSREYKFMGPDAVGGWRQQSGMAGTGILGDLGSHLLDMVRYAVAPVAEVCGTLVNVPRTLHGDSGRDFTPDVDDVASLLFRTATGVSGDVFASWAAPTHDRRTLEVVGDRGTLLANLTRGEDELLRLVRPGKALRDAEVIALPLDAPANEPSALGRMMQSFVDAVQRGSAGPDDATFADGRAAQEAIDAVVASTRSRKWEPVVGNAEVRMQS